MAGEWRQGQNKQSTEDRVNIGDKGLKVYVDRRKESKDEEKGGIGEKSEGRLQMRRLLALL